jgi:hypothetical protein
MNINRLQIFCWYKWKGIKFTKGNPLKSAFYLIYKWSFNFLFWEIRKFMNKEEMAKALNIYKNNSQLII